MILYKVDNSSKTYKIIEKILDNPLDDYYLFPRKSGVTTAIANVVSRSSGKCAYLGQSGILDYISISILKQKLNHREFYADGRSLIRDYIVGEPLDILYVDNRYWIYDKSVSSEFLYKLSMVAKKIVFIATVDFDGISNIHIPKDKTLQIIQFAYDDDNDYNELLYNSKYSL